MEAFHRIETWTRALQRAASRHAWWEAACTTTLLLSAGLAGALAVAAWTGPGWGRWAWASVALATGAAVRAWWRGWWRDDLRRDAIAVARFAEARLPDMESGIVTALECSALLRDDRSGSWPRPSQALVEASVERTWTRLQGVKAEQLVDGSRLLKLRNATLLALALWGLVATAAPSWIEAGLHGLTATAPSDGEAVSIELALRDLTLELRPPEYLHRDTRTLKGTRGDVSTIAGTTVVVSGHPTVPTERAELLLDFARTHRLPMTMATDGRFSASFVAKESGRYRIALLPGEGERVEETQGRILDIRPDVLPSVRMLRPETDLEVRAGDPISMAYEASDDHGVAEIALWIDGPVGGAERRVLRRGVRDSVLKGVDEIGVASLGLSPGESAELWLEVVDGNDVSGPGVGRSRRVRIWLFSPEMEHARRLSDLESLIEAMIGLLADRLESPIRDEKPERIIEAVIWHQAIVTMAAQLIESVENLIGALNTDTLASESLRALLTETLTTLQSHRTQEDAMLRRAVLANSQHKQPRVLQRLIHQANDEATGDLERTIFALKDELERSRQDRVLEEGRDLLDAQESLRELMAQLKEGEVDPALMEEAERRIDQLEASLARMARELDQLAERSPYENQNPATRPSETQEDVESMESEMNAIRQLLREGKVEEAMKRLEALNKATQEWMATMNQDFGERESDADSPHRRALTEFQIELSELADGQRGVEGETGDEASALDEERLRALEAELADTYAEALALARKLVERLDEAPEHALHEVDQSVLEERLREAQQVEKMVLRKALGEALTTLPLLKDKLTSLRDEVSESEARESDAQRQIDLRAVLSSLDDGKSISDELIALLERLSEQLEKAPSGAVKKRLMSIGKRQRALRRAAGRLQGRLEGLEEALPGVGEELGPLFDAAKGEMRQARDALDRGAPREAQERQRQALDQLEQAQGRFERRSKGSREGRGGGQGLSGARDPVTIPDSDPYAAPEAFRRELIEAMRERAPAGYEEAVQRYYEELTR